MSRKRKCAHELCTSTTEPAHELCARCCETLPLGRRCAHCRTPIAPGERLRQLQAVNGRFASALRGKARPHRRTSPSKSR